MCLKYNWLVLIYANGNNDLEPEIYQRFLELQEQAIPQDSAVVIQIARASQKIVQAFRPQLTFQERERWSGVRRYLIQSNQTEQVADLGNVNMADPASLENFITWGIQNYSAQYIMLILSSHGGGFVWHMADFMQSIPYVMPIKGLIGALSSTKRKTARSIDVLVMDICYMNMIEIWYEFAYAPESPVCNLLVALENPPMEGLPYTWIIKGLQDVGEFPPAKILASITSSFNRRFGLLNGVLFLHLDQQKFQTVKRLISQVGHLILAKDIDLTVVLRDWYSWRPHYPLINILDLFFKIESEYPYLKQLSDQISQLISEIIIAPSLRFLPRNQTLGPCMYLETNPGEYSYFQFFYEDMLFSQQNQWPNVLSNMKPIKPRAVRDISINELPPPSPMHIELVFGFLVCYQPAISVDNARKIIQTLGWDWRK